MKRFVRFTVVSLLCASMYLKVPMQAQQQPRVIEIHAKRFSFEPASIEITKGEPVTLSIIAEDTTHGLSIPELGVSTELSKGKATKIELNPQQAGTFQGRCSHFCGVGHGSMVFSVTVKEK